MARIYYDNFQFRNQCLQSNLVDRSKLHSFLIHKLAYLCLQLEMFKVRWKFKFF
jgi:hypothetical protein